MRKEIIDFLSPLCEQHDLGLNYIPDERPNQDSWLIHKRGRAVFNMSTQMFYQVPKWARKKQFLPAIKRGLMLALGDPKQKDNMLSPVKYGKIIRHG